MNTICYECGIPCPRAGKKLSKESRECNGWKDPAFFGCAALESPKEKRKARRSIHKTAMQLAMEKAGIKIF